MHGARTLVPLALAGWLGTIGSFWTAMAAGDEPGPWRSNFSEARAEAERQEKPLLVHFSATWCLPCAKMDRDVLKSADVKKLLGDKFVGVKVDADRNRQLVLQYNVELLPSDVIIDPINGRVLAESQGSVDLKRYVSFALRGDAKFQQALARHQAQRLAKQQEPADKGGENRLSTTTTKESPADSSAGGDVAVDLGTPQPLIGLDGYSPVALTRHRKWVRGSAALAWDYQGISYHMATRDEFEAFRQNPEAYAPRLLGCDPVILWETDRVVPGRTLYGAFYDDQLYLFTSDENRKRFKANPERFIKTQHVLRTDQIDRTALVEESHLK